MGLLGHSSKKDKNKDVESSSTSSGGSSGTVVNKNDGLRHGSTESSDTVRASAKSTPIKVNTAKERVQRYVHVDALPLKRKIGRQDICEPQMPSEFPDTRHYLCVQQSAQRIVLPPYQGCMPGETSPGQAPSVQSPFPRHVSQSKTTG